MGEGLLGYHKGETAWDKFVEDIREGWKTHRARMEENW